MSKKDNYFELIKMDLQSYENRASRDQSRIYALRGWHITLIAALLVLYFKEIDIQIVVMYPFFLITLLFLILECGIRSDIYITKKELTDKYRILSKNKINKDLYRNWIFRSVSESKWSLKIMYKYSIKSVLNGSVITWYCIVSMAFLSFFLFK